MAKNQKVSCSSIDSDGDIIHSGILVHKYKGKLSTSFHTVACSLHRGTLDGVRRLELRDSNTGKVTVVSLSDLLDVKENSKKEKEFYYPFEVMCLKSKHTFAAETPEERVEWITSMRKLFSGEPEPGVTYEFRVTIQSNESSKRYRLSGNYILRVSDTNLTLYSATGLIQTAFRLTLSDIKRLQQCSLVDKNGLKEDILVIYSMPNSGIGEGTYVFSASNASEISQLIDKRIKVLLQSGLPGDVPSNDSTSDSPTPPQVPDRKKRNHRHFETHTYYEESRINLQSSLNGSQQNSPMSEEGRMLTQSLPSDSDVLNRFPHRRTLSSIRRSPPRDLPPAPPPRRLNNQGSFTGSESSQVDEPILVESKDIIASVQDLRKKGILRALSEDKTPSPPPRDPSRHHMKRNMSDQRIMGSPTMQHSDWSSIRASSQSPPSSSSPTSMWSSHSPTGRRNFSHSDWSPTRKQRSTRSTDRTKLAKTHSGEGGPFPLDKSTRHDYLVKRHNTAEQLRLSEWLPQKLKQSRNAPDLPSRDRSGNDIYYVSNTDINPGPVRNTRPVHPTRSSGSEVGSVTSSSTDDNGYLILKADEREMMKQMAQEQALQLKGKEELEKQQQEISQTESMVRPLASPPTSTSDRESSGSPYYNMEPGTDISQNGILSNRSRFGHQTSNGIDDDDDDSSDLDHASTWTSARVNGVESPDSEYYNSTLPLRGQRDTEKLNGECQPRKKGVLERRTHHVNEDSEDEYYNDPIEITDAAKSLKRFSITKSSSITGINQITPSVSATHYGECKGGSDVEDGDEEDPEITKLTRHKTRKESLPFQSVEALLL